MTADDPRRQPDLYWRQLEQLKAAAVAMRLYRNRLNRRVRAVELVKAIAGNGAIAAWVVFRDHPFLWSGIIGAAQFLDAIKGVFPFAALHKQASNLTVALELLVIGAEDEWERIHMGPIQESAVIEARSRLRRLKLEAEHRHFPDGLELPSPLMTLAIQETSRYLRDMYGRETGA